MSLPIYASFLPRHSLYIASALAVGLPLSGCSAIGQYQRYSRPELFYPTTEVLKQQLEDHTGPAVLPVVPPVVAPIAPLAIEPLEILTVGELASNDGTVREIRVSDRRTAPQVPILQAEPAAMVTSRLALEPGKRAIPNFLPPFPMYIAEIREEDVPIKAVLLEKKATISNGAVG